MDSEQLIQQARALRDRIQAYAAADVGGEAAQAQVCEFLRQYAGPKSAFTKQAESAGGYSGYLVASVTAILESFIQYVEAGLATGVSPERRAQLDVVSDILGQAQYMLEKPEYHPAASAMLIGAALEEFLRTWVESIPLSIGNSKPGIDAYCKALRAAEVITKQDVKDITSWAGTRNHAAHGEWDSVANPDRVRLMLEGVNLFMRQNSISPSV